MAWKRFSDSSLHPPPLSDVVADDTPRPPPWILLDKQAYIADRRDHTTAHALTRDGGEIRATFVLGAPPRVSYHCVSSSTELGTEPRVLATHADLTLLFSFHGSPSNLTVPDTHEYYVYQASGDRPALTLLPRPRPYLLPWLWQKGYFFHESQAGILRYRNPTDVDGGGAFLVAALCTQEWSSAINKDTMDLYTYDSETNAWSCHPATFTDGKLPDSALRCDTVITVGGEAGIMGWVNLMRCIILCYALPLDESKKEKTLRCVPVPPPILPSNTLDDTLSMYRDIAVVGGRIRYVEVQMHARPRSGRGSGIFISDGWTAVTWSRGAADSTEAGWRKDHELHAHELDGSAAGVPGYELLPTLLGDNGRRQPTLERIHVGHPKLGLQEDDVDIVYLMAKVNRRLDNAWVIAVDMKNKRLRGVAEFAGAKRGLPFINAYNHSGISRYMNPE